MTKLPRKLAVRETRVARLCQARHKGHARGVVRTGDVDLCTLSATYPSHSDRSETHRAGTVLLAMFQSASMYKQVVTSFSLFFFFCDFSGEFASETPKGVS